MADKADNTDIDALLNAVRCEAFDRAKVHRMVQTARLRIIAEGLKVRDQATVELIQLLREAESLSRKSPAPSRNPIKMPGWAKGVLVWALRNQLKAAAGVAGLLVNACVIILLGALVQASSRKAAVEQERGNAIGDFVSTSQQKICSPAPQACLPPHQDLRNPYKREVLQKVLGECQQFLDHYATNPVMGQETGRTRYLMGCILLLLGKQNEARDVFENALPSLRELAVEFPDNPVYQRMVGEIYLNLGSLLAEEDPTSSEAEQAFGEALSCFTKLVERFPDQSDYQFQLAGTHEQMGTLFENTGRPREAEQEFQRTQRLLSALEKQGPDWSTKYQLGLVQSHLSLGSLQLAARQLDEARDAFAKAGALLAKLSHEVYSVPENRCRLAGQYNELGNLLLKEGRLLDAQRVYGQARDLWEGLATAFPKKLDYQSHLGFSLMQLGLVAREQGNLNECCRLLTKAAGYQQAVLAIKPKRLLYRESLRDTYLALAATQMRRQQYQEAAEAANQLPQIFPNRWEEHFRVVGFLSRCLVAAEKDPQLERTQRQDLVNAYRSQLQNHLQEVSKQSAGNPAAANELAWFLATCPKPEFRDPARALALAQEATRLNPKKGGYWNTLGVAHFRLGEWKKAVTALQRSMDQCAGGDSTDWFFLAMAYWQLDQEKEARRWYKQALDWMEQHKPHDEELLRFRAEVTKLIDPSGALTRGGTKAWPEN